MPKILSKFVFNKLIFDYLTGHLEKSKINKFEQKMNAEHDCKDQVELVQKSMSYIEELSKLTINTEFCKEIINTKIITPKKKIKNSINNMYTRTLTIIFLFLVVGLSFYKLTTYIPDSYLKSLNVSLQSFFKEKTVTNKISMVDPVLDSIYKKELMSKAAVTNDLFTREYKTLVNKKNTMNKKEITKSTQEVSEEPKIKDVSIQATKDVSDSKVATFEIKSQSNIEIINKIESEEKPVKGPKGNLYRYYMSLHGMDVNTGKIVKMIKDLGGERAGESPLGYEKPKGRYFHLKLPTEKLKVLNIRLGGLGLVRINQEKHWRRMNEGVSRVIIWVEDLDLKAQRLKRR